MRHTTTRNACYFLLVEFFLADAMERVLCEKNGLKQSGYSVREGWGNSLKQAKKNAQTSYFGNCELSCIMDETKVIVNNRTVKDTLWRYPQLK